MRPNAVTSSGANCSRSTVTVPVSQIVVITGRTSNGVRSRAGITARSAVWSAAGPAGRSPAKYPTRVRASATAAASSGTTASMTPLGAITDTGPNSSARCSPSPPAASITGPATPKVVFSVAMSTSALAASTALPAKHGPALIAMRGATPESFAHSANVRTSRAETAG